VRGRANYNAMRRLQARRRQGKVLQLLARFGWKYGVQSLIAQHLGVHKSTICRDLAIIMPFYRECPTCHHLRPRDWWREET
jgi:transposase